MNQALMLKKKRRTLELLTNKEILEKLERLFSKCIGKRNGVTKMEIFRYIWGSYNEYSPLQVWFLWEKIRHVMKYMRHKTHYFVIPGKSDGKLLFFIVKTLEEAKEFEGICDKRIRGLNKAKMLCFRAVAEEYWKEL